MAMRLYKKDEIIACAKKHKLKFETEIEDHLVFSDEHGDPYSVPCPNEGCPDYLYDLFVAKINHSDSKVVGMIQKKFDISS